MKSTLLIISLSMPLLLGRHIGYVDRPVLEVEEQSCKMDENHLFIKVKTGLGRLESNNNYTAINKYTNALGKYQFIPRYYWYKKPDKNTMSITSFAKTLNIKIRTHSDFLHNPFLQEKYFKHYYENRLIVRVRRLVRKYGDKGFLEDNLIALYHFEPLTLTNLLVKGVHRKEVNNDKEQNISSIAYLQKFNQYTVSCQ